MPDGQTGFALAGTFCPEGINLQIPECPLKRLTHMWPCPSQSSWHPHYTLVLSSRFHAVHPQNASVVIARTSPTHETRHMSNVRWWPTGKEDRSHESFRVRSRVHAPRHWPIIRLISERGRRGRGVNSRPTRSSEWRSHKSSSSTVFLNASSHAAPVVVLQQSRESSRGRREFL